MHLTAGGAFAPLDPTPDIVLFDLDNTICDYAGARLARTRYAFESSFHALDELEIAIDAAMRHDTDGSEHFAEVLAAHGVTNPAQVDAARARYIEDRYRGLTLFDEALEVVAAVRSIAAVGMVTNGPTAIQRPKIELLQLEVHFPVIIVSEEAGVWKPDPRIFEIALERLGGSAERAVYVGDSAQHDVPGAHAAGMQAVWVNRGGGEWPGGRPPEAEVRSLRELLPLLGMA